MSDAMITAFGDDPATGVKEGFGDNERINWKIYSWNLKSEHIAIPSYDPDFPDYDGKFSAGGSSSLTELSGLSLLKNQVLQLSQNWSGISSYIEPVDTLVESLFEPVVDDMVVLQQQNLVYWPAFDINTIVYWDAHKGYIVKMTDPQYLFLTGWEVSDKSIDLSPGWCDIPVLSSTEVLSDVVFGPLGDDLVVATEIAGSKVYWPAMGIFSLDTLQPGKSYYVFLNNAVTIIFP
jgi:hypothetical protein